MLRIRTGRGILILNPQGFGNVVMSVPLIRAICDWAGRRWPVMVLLASRDHYQLIQEEQLDVAPLYYSPDCAGALGVIRLCRRLIGKVDLVVGVPQVQAEKIALLKAALGARHSAGEAFRWNRWLLSFPVEKGWTKSILQTQVEIARALEIPHPLRAPGIRLTRPESSWADTLKAAERIAESNPVVGVHCSAAQEAKKWPAQNFGHVIAYLKEQLPKLAVVSFGTAEDRSGATEARRVCGDVDWVEGTGRWSIRQSLAMLRKCDLVISGDTGMMHMAAAVGARTLSIFGGTSPSRVAPDYNGGVVVFPGTPCHPCYRDRYKKCDCIGLIGPGAVARLAGQMLASPGGRSGNEESLATKLQYSHSNNFMSSGNLRI